MSLYPPDLASHLAGTATTVCQCWKLTRKDGTVLGFTDHDLQLEVDGVSFEPQAGFTASEARSSLGLAVDTVDIEGALSSASIDEADIEAGHYDGATVETMLVNWQEPSGFAVIRKAIVGKITRSDGALTAELESLAQSLDQPSGRYARRGCDAELGDDRCRFDLTKAGFSGDGAVVSLETEDTLIASGLDAFEAGWFANGLLTWTSGALAGTADRIVEHQPRQDGVALTIWRDGPVTAAPGDAFHIVAGCDKSFATCKAKFANFLNFRGFPHLPGNDAAYGYVTDGADFDGGPLVP
ncbi:MAG: DUF2163 domain-containing protein [Rhizobiaceae bacterium]|nr:MAG: DUF2163 domain-containing protein [Rhizobiaceae bacterium]